MQVICGDVTALPIVAGDFDALICDPPYSDHVHANAVSQSASRGTRTRDLGFVSLSPSLRDCIAKASAAVRRWSVIYSDVEGLHEWRSACVAAGAQYIRPVPWVRWSMPQLSGDRPPSGCEFISCFWGSNKGRKSWNGPGNLTSLTHKCLRGEGKHKTEKPLDQMLDLVSWFTSKGDHVLDMTAGAGTTGLACKLLGREFTGYEIDPKWADHANARITAPLAPRDEERAERWLASQAEREIEQARIDANTDRARAALSKRTM